MPTKDRTLKDVRRIILTNAIPYHHQRLLDEAASWIARLRAPDASSRDKSDFSRWLNQSPEHIQAFDEMSETWASLGAAAHIEELTTPLSAPSPANQKESDRWNWSFWQGGLAMACVAGLFALITLVSPSDKLETQRYETLAGQQRTITLDDGSMVSLNTRTQLEVSYSDNQRNLALLSGEAYFDVASDKQRPFVIEVGQGTVMAVGTAFNIHRHNQTAKVVVTEGVVQMREHRDPATPTPKIEHLNANQQAHFGKRGLSNVSHAETKNALAWREQTLVFDQVSLTEALKELNRYLQEPVDYSHASLRELEVSGTFSVKAPEATLQALKASFNLAAPDTAPQSLYLIAE